MSIFDVNINPATLDHYLVRNHNNYTGFREALSATYVRFEDEAGNPLPNRNVVIKVNATTGEIIDIVSEA